MYIFFSRLGCHAHTLPSRQAPTGRKPVVTKGAPRLRNVEGGSDFHENPRKVTVTSRRTKNRNYSCVTHGTVDESGGDDETKREKN